MANQSPYGGFVDLTSYRGGLGGAGSNPLESLIQGFTQGQAIRNLPETLETQRQMKLEQELTRRLNNAISMQKLQDLQNPQAALAREVQKSLAISSANPVSGVVSMPAGLEGETIMQPGALTPEQQLALDKGGAAPTVAPVGVPITPLNLSGAPTGFGQDLTGATKAAEAMSTAKGTNAMDIAVLNMLGRQNLQDTKGEKTTPFLIHNKSTGEQKLINLGAGGAIPEGWSVIPKTGERPETQKVYDVISPDGTRALIPMTATGLNEFLAGGGKIAPKPTSSAEEKAKATLTNNLAKQVQSNKAYQAHRTISDALEGLQATLDYANSNPQDQTGIKSSAVDAFNRIINPNSIVRQQAFAQTTTGASLINKTEIFFNGLLKSETITPMQIQAMLDLAKKYEESSRKSAQKELTVFKHRGDKAGIDPEDYLPGVFGNTDTTPSEAAQGKILIIAPDGTQGYWPSDKPIPSGYTHPQ